MIFDLWKRRLMLKQHSLVDHWNDVRMWWWDTRVLHGLHFISPMDEQVIFFTAYERWMNDRELLSVEDGFVFAKFSPDPVRDHPGRVSR